ncbi:hypothetical protein D3C83_72810 [compost metagenome]
MSISPKPTAYSAGSAIQNDPEAAKATSAAPAVAEVTPMTRNSPRTLGRVAR